MPPKKPHYCEDSDSDGEPFEQPQRRGGAAGGSSRGKKQKLDKESDEYKKRRERNNLAVKKSREASRQKMKTTMDKVSKLREENQQLEQRVTILNKELGVLRDLFLTQAAATGGSVKQESAAPEIVNLNKIIKQEDSSTKKDHLYTSPKKRS